MRSLLLLSLVSTIACSKLAVSNENPPASEDFKITGRVEGTYEGELQAAVLWPEYLPNYGYTWEPGDVGYVTDQVDIDSGNFSLSLEEPGLELLYGGTATSYVIAYDPATADEYGNAAPVAYDVTHWVLYVHADVYDAFVEKNGSVFTGLVAGFNVVTTDNSGYDAWNTCYGGYMDDYEACNALLPEDDGTWEDDDYTAYNDCVNAVGVAIESACGAMPGPSYISDPSVEMVLTVYEYGTDTGMWTDTGRDTGGV